MVTRTQDSVKVRIGEPFSIDLEANPTTGYQWTPAFPSEKVRLIQREFRPASAGIGAGGGEHFVFEALMPGEVELAFDYKRVWEAEPLRRHVVHMRAV
jgi:inhibitor of cysteine peptidase